MRNQEISPRTLVDKMISFTVFPEDVLETEQSCSWNAFWPFGILTYFLRKLSIIPKKNVALFKNFKKLCYGNDFPWAPFTTPLCSLWVSSMVYVTGWFYLSWLTVVFVSSQSPRILLTLGCDKQLFSEIEDKTPQQNQGVYKTEAMALVNLHSLVGTLENMALKLNSPEVTSLWSFSLERCPAICLMIELKQLKYGLNT